DLAAGEDADLPGRVAGGLVGLGLLQLGERRALLHGDTAVHLAGVGVTALGVRVVVLGVAVRAGRHRLGPERVHPGAAAQVAPRGGRLAGDDAAHVAVEVEAADGALARPAVEGEKVAAVPTAPGRVARLQ